MTNDMYAITPTAYGLLIGVIIKSHRSLEACRPCSAILQASEIVADSDTSHQNQLDVSNHLPMCFA